MDLNSLDCGNSPRWLRQDFFHLWMLDLGGLPLVSSKERCKRSHNSKPPLAGQSFSMIRPKPSSRTMLDHPSRQRSKVIIAVLTQTFRGMNL
eukprot:symbB.v1.2.039764.t1/scaffold6770.1/size15648/2